MPNLFYRLFTLPAQVVLPVMTTHHPRIHGPWSLSFVMIAVKSEQNDAALVVSYPTRQCPSPNPPVLV